MNIVIAEKQLEQILVKSIDIIKILNLILPLLKGLLNSEQSNY